VGPTLQATIHDAARLGVGPLKGVRYGRASKRRALLACYEAFTKGDADAIRELLADDLLWHVPGRHRFSGDHNKVEIMALFEGVTPQFSETGQPVTTTFNIEVEGVIATDEWVFTRVHWNHTRNGKHFDQHGVEVNRVNADGRITEFWAFMRDTVEFDEFFA
jgi:ketosteroid isomerase-like protein